jgi:hypothetical protein
MRITVIVGILLLTVSGCATSTLQSKTFKSYTVGQTKTATIGDAFLVDQNGTVSTVREWVGVLNSPDGWRVSQKASEDFVRRAALFRKVCQYD